MVLAQLRHQRGRFVATLLAVAVAVAGFSLLLSAARGAQVRATGTVQANFRPLYDILVRPADAGAGQIGFDQVGTGRGGITMQQWHDILALPGVAVAAPLAAVGTFMQPVRLPVDLTGQLRPGAAQQALRVRPTWVTDRGLTSVTDGAIYLWVTGDVLEFQPGEPWEQGRMYEGDEIPEREHIWRIGADGSRTEVCEPLAHQIGVTDPLDPKHRRALSCWSSDPRSTVAQPRRAEVYVAFTVPMAMAAVDPAQEARLNGLDATALTRPAAPGEVPVLASTSPAVDRQVRLRIDRLSDGSAASGAAGARLDNLIGDFEADPGSTVDERTVDVSDVYQQLLADLSAPEQHAPEWGRSPAWVGQYWMPGPAGAARPATGDWGGAADDEVWYNPLPLELTDPQVRALPRVGAEYTGPNSIRPVTLRGVGAFDPGTLDAGPPLATLPASLTGDPALTGADAASRTALGNQALLPGGNIGGPAGARPTLITSLSAMSALRSPPYTPSSTAASAAFAEAPIGTVRVRVTGDVGMDDLSQERVRAVAERIQQATGLRVDLTVGSSVAPADLAVPAGVHGRPALTVDQSWLRTGVATVVVSAIDRKSLLLAGLVLVACVLAVANATGAALRARHTELAVLACLGWPGRRLFGLVLAEALALGLSAGLAGTVIALAAAPALGITLQWTTAAVAVPAALLLSVLAALQPAWRANRTDPVAAVRPAVSPVRRARTPRRIAGLAWTNLLRTPGRTLVGVLSLAIGVAALTFLAVLTIGFRGTVSGTVLGDAVTVQVRGTDYLAAVLTVLLGAAAVADVLYRGIRERAGEFALLGASGWGDHLLVRLAGYEALALGTIGALLGTGISLGLAYALGGALPGPVWLAAAGAAVAGLLVTVAAATVPLRALRRLPTARLLAEA
ncbi:FtsX-like permease family protein [Dactylosporangium cerinum]|uniref:FtsX-like permease family protein n=1 Tax=Dactylosporangium cerinum TaxID=1434730 RepID=A0ABV9WCU9_9ACTN